MLAANFRKSLARQISRAFAPTATVASGGRVRNLNVQEYVSMELMRQYELPTPVCYTATTPAQAEQIYAKLNPRKSIGRMFGIFKGALVSNPLPLFRNSFSKQ